MRMKNSRNSKQNSKQVANEAASFVHSFFFSTAPAFGKMEEHQLGFVLNHMDLLKASSITKFLNLRSSISTSAYVTPKTCVVDSLHIVDSLIYDLKDMMKQQDNPIADVMDQIRMLHQRLTFLRSSIKDTGAPQPTDIGEMKEPLMRIGNMAVQADYLINSFLVGDAPFWYLINRLTEVNYKIELIGTELQQITRNYISGGSQVAKDIRAQVPLLDKRNTEADGITVGFEDKTTDILNQLVGEVTEHLQVISIFGMPGLRKTTLAKKLYNHPSVNYWYDKLSWCVVSQTYQRLNTLTDILIHTKSELEKDRILETEEESLVEQIYKTLKGRRYLIIMDDIWDLNFWDDLRICFPHDGNGSRVLLTTRNRDVAPPPPNSIIYELPSLSSDQCWELLEKKLFKDEPCPPELFGIGKKMQQIATDCHLQ